MQQFQLVKMGIVWWLLWHKWGIVRIKGTTERQTQTHAHTRDSTSSSSTCNERKQKKRNTLEELSSGHLPGALCSGTLKLFSYLVSPSARSPWRAPHDILCGRSFRPAQRFIQMSRCKYQRGNKEGRCALLIIIIFIFRGNFCRSVFMLYHHRLPTAQITDIPLDNGCVMGRR